MNEVNDWGFPEKISGVKSTPREFRREKALHDIREWIGRMETTLSAMKEMYVQKGSGPCCPVEDLEQALKRFDAVEQAFFTEV